MKKTNFIFAVFMTLFFFTQVQAQEDLSIMRFENSETKEAIFIGLDNNSPSVTANKIWYAPKSLSNIQEVSIIKSPEERIWEVNIPNKGKCTIEYVGPMINISYNGKTETLLGANAYVNPDNTEEVIYHGGSFGGFIFTYQNGQTRVENIRGAFTPTENHFGITINGEEYILNIENDQKWELKHHKTGEVKYFEAFRP